METKDIVGEALAGDATEETTESGALKPGDHGKRILSAIASKDAVALETAIRDCVEDTSY